ncbi:MAG: hypothetical protein JRM82_01330 [Nitrososphaerota archaeon]|nr:hypothetical protein [Nitrososphaerota archaeon]
MTFKIKFELGASNDNLLNFFRYVGFCFDAEKRLMARQGEEYLHYKAGRLDARKKLASQILVALREGGGTVTELAREYHCSTDFVRNIRLLKEPKQPRRGLLTFDMWRDEYWIKGSEFVWDSVEELTRIALPLVVDVTTKHYHSFIANGFVSHNCNYSSGIIEPLQSRCAIFRFQRYDETAVVAQLKEIAKKEKVKVAGDAAFGEIFEATQGDLRQAINLMQAASVSGELTVESVKSVTGATVKVRVAEIVRLALDGDFEGARGRMVELTRVYGVPERDFLKFANEALSSSKMDDVGRAISIIAEYDFRLVQGAQPELQLTAMLAELSALKEKGN